MTMKTTFRVTFKGDETELFFRNPTQAELLAMDMEFRRIFSQCLRDGIICEAEARKIAIKNGTWIPQDDEEVTRLSIEIGVLESIIQDADVLTAKGERKFTDEEVKNALEKIAIARKELLNKISTKVEVVSHTAEGLANQQRMHKFVEFCCVKAKDNSQLFNGREEYEAAIVNQREVMSEIYKEAYFTEYGNPAKMAEEWAEIKYIRRQVEKAENRKVESTGEEQKDQKVVPEIKEDKKS